MHSRSCKIVSTGNRRSQNCTGCRCTPRAEEKIGEKENVQEKVVSAPQAEQESIFDKITRTSGR